MNFHIVSIFPDSLDSYLNESILGRAIENKIIRINKYAIREFTTDKHGRVDGIPYGGGPGMVMWVDPIVNVINQVNKNIEKRVKKEEKKLNKKIKQKSLFIHFSPAGTKLNTEIAKNYTKKYTDIIFICGRYEGIDYRINEIFKGDTLSIGDYVLTGGELPALVCIDTISRQISGVLNKSESLEENRVSSGKVYARPEIYEYKYKDKNGNNKIKKYKVPAILLSGNHKLIDEWRENEGKI